MLISKTWALSPKEVTPLPRHYYLELVKQLHEKLSLNIGEDKIPSVSYPRRFDQLLANVAHLLCEYSSFASTGVKTRLGMGQTQLLNKDK